MNMKIVSGRRSPLFLTKKAKRSYDPPKAISSVQRLDSIYKFILSGKLQLKS